MTRKFFLGSSIVIIIFLLVFVSWIIIKTAHRNTPARSSVSHRMPLPKETIITLNKDGFSPSQVTIKVGSAIRWKNESGSQQTVNSDNYPTNQLNKELNFGVFNNNSTVMYIFTKPGTYGYHNQFHHEQQGKIIVE